MIGWDALLVLDLLLDSFDGVRGLDLEGDGLSRECLDEDLHPLVYYDDDMLRNNCYEDGWIRGGMEEVESYTLTLLFEIDRTWG